MAAISLDGAAVCTREIKEELRDQIASLRSQGITPGLGTILVGDDPASAAYVRMKHATARRSASRRRDVRLPAEASQADVLAAVERSQRRLGHRRVPRADPVPEGARRGSCAARGRSRQGCRRPAPRQPGPARAGRRQVRCRARRLASSSCSCTTTSPSQGRHVVIVGRGPTLGRPLALLLALKRPDCNAAVTVVHTGVPTSPTTPARPTSLVAAAGVPGLVTPDMVKPGAAVVGAGVTMDGKRIVSDVVEEVVEVAGWITPRVGGVGPMTARDAVAQLRRRPRSAVPRDCDLMTKIADLLAAGPTFSFEFFPPKTDAEQAHAGAHAARARAARPVVRVGHLPRRRASSARAHARPRRRHAQDHDAHADGAPHLRRAHAPRAGRDPRRVPQGRHRERARARRRPAHRCRRGARASSTYAVELVELARRDRRLLRSVSPPIRSCIPVARPRQRPSTTSPTSCDAADFAITQFFFEADDYVALVDELDALGIDKPVLARHHADHQRCRRIQRMAQLMPAPPCRTGCGAPRADADDARRGARPPASSWPPSSAADLLDAGRARPALLHAQPLHRDTRDLRSLGLGPG